MTSVIAISAVIVLLAAMVCYALVVQTLNKKRQQKQLLLTALKTRQRNFKFMLSAFPKGFLTQDLILLIYRCLVDVYEQLAQLVPEDGQYLEELKLYRGQMEEAKNNPQGNKRVTFDSPQIATDTRKYLEELYKVLHQLYRKGSITKNHLDAYSAQIKALVLQLSVDTYVLHAKQASQGGKARMAVHYYGLAKKLLIRENAQKNYQQQIEQLDTVINSLNEQLKISVESQDGEAKHLQDKIVDKNSKDWDEFNKEDESWKKRKIYD